MARTFHSVATKCLSIFFLTIIFRKTRQFQKNLDVNREKMRVCSTQMCEESFKIPASSPSLYNVSLSSVFFPPIAGNAFCCEFMP